MRALGLDYGDKTIGVALGDPFGWTAQGVEVIRRSSGDEYKQSLKRIAELVEEYEVDTIVVGYPKNLDNSLSARCEKTEIFAEKLKNRFSGMEIVLWDERLSTVAAQRDMISAGLSREKRKSIIDKQAAIFILQGYLDSKRER